MGLICISVHFTKGGRCAKGAFKTTHTRIRAFIKDNNENSPFLVKIGSVGGDKICLSTRVYFAYFETINF